MAKTSSPVLTTRETETFDIEQASKACGLSAGVLRMWELRYGWPRPGRLPNGYRYFTRYQIEDLRRMSTLVKTGMLISRLIQDGMPKWPSDGTNTTQAHVVTLEATLNLPKPKSAVGNTVRDKLLESLKTQNHGRTWEMLLRCAWEVHPAEQVLAGWLPCLTALEEYQVKDRPFPRQDVLSKYIRDHIKDVLSRFPPDARPLWVIPASEADQTTAYLASLILSRHGTVARPWLWDKLPGSNAKFITVGAMPAAGKFPSEQHVGHFKLIDQPDQAGITGFVNQKREIPDLSPVN